jgi:hypothetical protein
MPRSSPADAPRVMLGLALQPFVAALTGFALVLARGALGAYGDGYSPDRVGAAAGAGVFVGIAAVFLTVFGAYPALRWMLTRGAVTRTHAVAAGALLGCVPGAMFVAASTLAAVRGGAALDPMPLLAGTRVSLLIGSTVGVVCASVFWLLAGRTLETHGGMDDVS